MFNHASQCSSSFFSDMKSLRDLNLNSTQLSASTFERLKVISLSKDNLLLSIISIEFYAILLISLGIIIQVNFLVMDVGFYYDRFFSAFASIVSIYYLI